MSPDDVKQRAAELGFDVCGIAPAANHRELAFLQEWLARGYAGEMHYLHRTANRRGDVRQVMPSARSVICLGTVYNTDRPYSTEIAGQSPALIARYAWGDDYHEVIQQRMDSLVAWMRERSGAAFEARAYVDTGPVQERVYAQYAGLGWIGRNTCLINPDVGSWLFLSEIICSLSLDPDPPALDQCGSCRLCLDSCPTGALVDSHVLDSTRCLSYLTIELKGAIPIADREPSRLRVRCLPGSLSMERAARAAAGAGQSLAAAPCVRWPDPRRIVANAGRGAATVARAQRDDTGGRQASPAQRGRLCRRNRR